MSIKSLFWSHKKRIIANHVNQALFEMKVAIQTGNMNLIKDTFIHNRIFIPVGMYSMGDFAKDLETNNLNAFENFIVEYEKYVKKYYR